MHHSANILAQEYMSFILLYIPLSLISIASAISVSLAVSIFLAIYNSRRILIFQIRKIIHKLKAMQTVRCVWPIDKEIAYKFAVIGSNHFKVRSSFLYFISPRADLHLANNY